MSIVKSGYIKRFSKNFLSGGWNNVYLVLYQDSYLVAYKKQGDKDPKVKICMKDVCKHFAFGDHVYKNFKDVPDLPGGVSANWLLAIPEKPSHKAKPHFFLARDDAEINEWMTAICSTLPQRAPKQETVQATNVQTTQNQPPPYSAPGPGMPQPQIGFAAAPPYPQQAPYPQQQPYQQQGAYPQQQYYPQQAYLQGPLPGYGVPPLPQGYGPAPLPQGYGPAPLPQGYGPAPLPQGYQPGPGYGYQQGYAQPHHKKGGLGGIMGSNTGKMAAGLIGGAALGYGASRMMGGFGGFGMGRCGSWSSMSSFGSFGSCGSFGSFGSFD